eukprot:gene22728-34803_t
MRLTWIVTAVVGLLLCVQLFLVPTGVRRSTQDDEVETLFREVEKEAKLVEQVIRRSKARAVVLTTRPPRATTGRNVGDSGKKSDQPYFASEEDTTPLKEALRLHHQKATAEVEESCTKTPDFQSSRHFRDFEAPKHAGWQLPTEQNEELATTCDPSNYEPSAEELSECVSFLSDLRNWKYLRPMSSILSKARTIKFVMQTSDPAVKAVLKIPQFKFVVEPYSEYASFSIDRLLNLRRVPPTAWVAVPVDWLRASMAVLMPSEYVQWVECFVFNHKQTKNHVKEWQPGVLSIYVSVQLWMKDVHELRSTSLRLSKSVVEEGLDPASGYGATSKIETWALEETSDLKVFDFIIANQDRTLLKNTFAVGKCGEPPWDCDSFADLKRVPHMVFLDQGSSLVAVRDQSMSSTVCKFRKRTFEAARQLVGKALSKAMEQRLPRIGFFDHWDKRQTAGAQTRLNSLVEHIKKCKEKYGANVWLDTIPEQSIHASDDAQ